ncbi:MAG: DUF3367 domain-containing protein, partial [Ilumatobacter sp.]|nr:DUF3367 domain-containing protein [Ilumatobacter sp.]
MTLAAGLRTRLAGAWPAVAVLAVLAYVPALIAAPGRMPSDSKLYLYLDPGGFFADAASTFDPLQFAGWVPHQHVAYLWPSLPWFWSVDALGIPDWIAHRLWIGTIMLAAGLGVRWTARLLGLGVAAALSAAIVYQTSLYVLPYVSRTSVMLLPWAGLGWIVAFTIRAGRRGGWADPAAIALVVLTVGAVNATALAMIVPAPVLWLLHAAWQRSIDWRTAALVAARTGVLSIGVSLWWIVMLVIQGRHGTDVLPYSESLADVSLTATAPETWRALGYWLFYVRDPYAATTTESLRYLSSSPAILVSYLIPLVAVTALVAVRWAHRRFAALLVGVGLVLAVGVHPVDDRSPLMRVFAGDDDGGLALALRSSTRALPLVTLGFGLAAAALVDALRSRSNDGSPNGRLANHRLAAVGVSALAIVNLPALWTGAFVDPALERAQEPPDAWLQAAAALDERADGGRVLQLPGAEFGAFRWGYTVDQPLPGLTDVPVVTRDLLPLGSPAAMDLLYALDDRIQDGVLEPAAVAPVARLLGADTVWLANDLAFDRFATARPEVVRELVLGAPGMGDATGFGEPKTNRPDVAMIDERAIADHRVGAPVPPVELVPVLDPVGVVRAHEATMLVSGNGDGLVDAAAAGLLAPTQVAVRYTADLDDPEAAIDAAVALVVTDSNRDRARHWRSSQDTTGFTEPGGDAPGVLRDVPSDSRLPVFDRDDAVTQTIAEQRGPVRASATAYGEPFAYLPEHRPFMAIDGDPETAWIVGEHGEPVGETLRLTYDEPLSQLVLRQPAAAGPDVRRITGISIVGLDGNGTAGALTVDPHDWPDGTVTVDVPFAVTSGELDITIDAVDGGVPFTGSIVAGVGFAEIEHGLDPTVEITRPPHDTLARASTSDPLAVVLTRQRVDPLERWRDDPEPALTREIELSAARTFDVDVTVRVDRRASDAALGALLGWPVAASSRLTGSPSHAGVAAFDADSDTAWITEFGVGVGATIEVPSASAPIDRIEVDQLVGDHSPVTELTLRTGDQQRVVAIAPDAAGRATAVVEPALPAGPLVIEVSGIEPRTTIDRRFGDPVSLPVAISELRFDGAPVVEPIETHVVTLPCTPVATIGDRVIEATISIDGPGWLDGEPVSAQVCDPVTELPVGDVLIDAATPVGVFDVDRIVLDDGARRAIEGVTSSAVATVVDSGRFGRTVAVDGCASGCWIVLGEGFNDAWSAKGPGGDLGEAVLLDGGFNGWFVGPDDGAVVVELRWTAQRWLWVAFGLT